MNWYRLGQSDYRGEHESPDKTSGSPMHNIIGIYPEDFYSHLGPRYYGDGSAFDYSSWSLITSVRNKPNAGVKVYRAIPKVLTQQDKINELEKQKAYILKYGKVPSYINTSLDSNRYYDKIYYELQDLRAKMLQNEEIEKKITINTGDWVTISRGYAAEHGQSNLNNNYKIISKTVRAKDLYTDGGSLHEWGYDP